MSNSNLSTVLWVSLAEDMLCGPLLKPLAKKKKKKWAFLFLDHTLNSLICQCLLHVVLETDGILLILFESGAVLLLSTRKNQLFMSV